MEIKKPVIAALLGIIVFSMASAADASDVTRVNLSDSALTPTCVVANDTFIVVEASGKVNVINDTENVKNAELQSGFESCAAENSSNSVIRTDRKATKETSSEKEAELTKLVSLMTGVIV